MSFETIVRILAALVSVGILFRVVYVLFLYKPGKKVGEDIRDLLSQFYHTPSEKVARNILKLLPWYVKTLQLQDGHPGGENSFSGLPTDVSRWFGWDIWTLDKVKDYWKTLYFS